MLDHEKLSRTGYCADDLKRAYYVVRQDPSALAALHALIYDNEPSELDISIEQAAPDQDALVGILTLLHYPALVHTRTTSLALALAASPLEYDEALAALKHCTLNPQAFTVTQVAQALINQYGEYATRYPREVAA